MSYLENIWKNSKKYFEDLKTIKHDKIKQVLESYNKSLLINKQKIIRENQKDIKNAKRKNLLDRLILN
jgi:gamma-glutamyl phosphate reductase